MLKNMGLVKKTTIPGFFLAVGVSIALYFLISGAQRDLAVRQASKLAKAISVQVAADRAVYTGQVVGKLKKDGVEIKPANMASYQNIPGGIPLPATFVHATSDEVNGGTHKSHTVDLLSLWQINETKGPRTPWEESALRYVAQQPNEIKGDVIGAGDDARFYGVTADVASAQACVNCHNNHPKSPKRDFKKNDVMGGLVVSVPMAEEFRLANSNAVTLTALAFSGFIFVLLLQFFIVGRPLVSALQGMEQVASKISMGDMDTQFVVDSNDEVGRLAKAFERMRTSLKAAMESMDDDE